LRNELERREPDAVARLNGRAMSWCLDNDLREEAVLYGHAAGETAAVAGLVDQLALPTYYDGRLETLEEWLGWFDDAKLRRFPALAVFGAWVRALTGRTAEAEQWLSLVDGKSSEIPLSDGSATIEPWVANLRAFMMSDGVDRALLDAGRALEQFPPGSDWVPVALLIRGVAHSLLGATDRAKEDLTAAVERGLAVGAVESVFVAQAELALMAARDGSWGDARRHAEEAQALVETTGLRDYVGSALTHVATARVALHEGRHAEARVALTRAHRLRPLLDHGLPWFTVQVGLELTRAHLGLSEAAAARTVFSEAERVLERRPHMGSLVEEAREVRDRVAATSGPAGAWAMSLTGAELRLLPYLATHLMFRRSRAGCSSPATRSRPRRSRSIANWVLRRAARPSSVQSKWGCWRAFSSLEGRISPRKDDAPTAAIGSDTRRRQWTSTRSTCVGSPCTTMRSSS
jgi:LuxR family maltose regulon positive regulatory protein